MRRGAARSVRGASRRRSRARWSGDHWGAGPRAGQAMILTAKASALLQGKFSVTLEDVKKIAFPVLRHRILMNFKAEAEGITPDQVTEKIMEVSTKSIR